MDLSQRIKRYREAAVRAVEFTTRYQLPDGGYIWDGYVKNAYHKQVYSWPIAGRFGETQRLLSWVKRNTLQSDGQLKDYHGDVYKLAWLVHGAQRLGRFDVSYPLGSFLFSYQSSCGGFPRYTADKLIRSVSTAWMGITALSFGKLDVTEKTAQCCISMLEQQPREDRFYCQLPDGSWIDEINDPDELLYYVDHAAEFCVWLLEIAAIMESKEGIVAKL